MDSLPIRPAGNENSFQTTSPHCVAKKEKKNRCPVCLASLSLNTDYRILTFESAWAGDVAQVCVLKAIGVIPSMELERQRQEDPLLHGVF